MADSMILWSQLQKPENGACVDSAKDSAPFQRKIEFHIARKQFNPYSSASGDFRLETLNPGVDPQRRPSSSTATESSGKKPNAAELLEHGLDLDFTFGMTVPRIVRGYELSFGRVFECSNQVWGLSLSITRRKSFSEGVPRRFRIMDLTSIPRRREREGRYWSGDDERLSRWLDSLALAKAHGIEVQSMTQSKN
ncbi:hypothetical protein H6P81_018044 [Aristolochia fimbriata]|uniref:Uncharacterized protein n=1 Tax=Aristolochia fimbriata TaxID=158543 RepID=A0AAV7DZX1_ARIFI|nr:hypothetical protein H6P81_018044 [Aristolochia fimbriata]